MRYTGEADLPSACTHVFEMAANQVSSIHCPMLMSALALFSYTPDCVPSILIALKLTIHGNAKPIPWIKPTVRGCVWLQVRMCVDVRAGENVRSASGASGS